MIPIGHKNFAQSDHIVGIFRPDSAAAKRLRRNAAESRLLISATNGRTTRSLIVMKTNHIVLSALTIRAIESRITKSLRKKAKGLGSFMG